MKTPSRSSRVVHHLTRRPAEHVGWLDRGLLAPGYLADVNVIDLDALGADHPGSSTTCPPVGAVSSRSRRVITAPSRAAW